MIARRAYDAEDAYDAETALSTDPETEMESWSVSPLPLKRVMRLFASIEAENMFPREKLEVSE